MKKLERKIEYPPPPSSNKVSSKFRTGEMDRSISRSIPPSVHNSSSIALDWLPSVTPRKWPLASWKTSRKRFVPTRERVYVSIGQLGRMLLRSIRPFIWLESAEATAGRWLLSRATNLVSGERLKCSNWDSSV